MLSLYEVLQQGLLLLYQPPFLCKVECAIAFWVIPTHVVIVKDLKSSSGIHLRHSEPHGLLPSRVLAAFIYNLSLLFLLAYLDYAVWVCFALEPSSITAVHKFCSHS